MPRYEFKGRALLTAAWIVEAPDVATARQMIQECNVEDVEYFDTEKLEIESCQVVETT